MARLRGIQATNVQTFAGSTSDGFPVVVLSTTAAAGKPYVIESVWLRVPSGLGELTSAGVWMCKTAAVRFDVTCRNIFRPAGANLSVGSTGADMDYSITIRWL
jgi:hypothetical protein